MRDQPGDNLTDIGPTGTGGLGGDPAEGRPDLGIPGADRQGPSTDPGDDLPEQLGRRIENGSSSGTAPGEPDLAPDVVVPETTM